MSTKLICFYVRREYASHLAKLSRINQVPRELCAVELCVEFVCLEGILPGLREWKGYENVMIAIAYEIICKVYVDSHSIGVYMQSISLTSTLVPSP